MPAPAPDLTSAPPCDGNQPKMINCVLGDVNDSLTALTARGFRFAETCDARGTVVAVNGVRVHHNVIDIVQLFGEHDADAVRIPGSEPDIFFPRNVLWRVTGRTATVLKHVLALADPVVIEPTVAQPTAAATPAPGGERRGSNRCWMPGRPSHSA